MHWQADVTVFRPYASIPAGLFAKYRIIVNCFSGFCKAEPCSLHKQPHLSLCSLPETERLFATAKRPRRQSAGALDTQRREVRFWGHQRLPPKNHFALVFFLGAGAGRFSISAEVATAAAGMDSTTAMLPMMPFTISTTMKSVFSRLMAGMQYM